MAFMVSSLPRTVDFHAHVALPACEAIVGDLFSPEFNPFSLWTTEETNLYNAKQDVDVAPALTDPSVRLQHMDRTGIDVQVVSITPDQYYYWTDPSLGRELSRMLNERIESVVSYDPDRFVGFATVPLQDVHGAISELDYCINELGFRGVEICTNMNGVDLDDGRFVPFFTRAADLDVVVFLHPSGFTEGRRLVPYYLNNVIGNPLDSTIAVTRLIHSGLFETLPGLKVCVAHGGGFLPFYASRMDHSYAVRPEGRINISRLPSSYLRQLYFDCLVYDEQHLGFLISQMGEDRVVIGTDYPYDMGNEDPVGQIERVPNLSSDQRAKVLGGTALRLLNLAG